MAAAAAAARVADWVSPWESMARGDNLEAVAKDVEAAARAAAMWVTVKVEVEMG